LIALNFLEVRIIVNLLVVFMTSVIILVIAFHVLLLLSMVEEGDANIMVVCGIMKALVSIRLLEIIIGAVLFLIEIAYLLC